MLLENAELLAQYGYEISDYGDGVLAIRQIPTEIAPDDAAQSLTALAAELLTGRARRPDGSCATACCTPSPARPPSRAAGTPTQRSGRPWCTRC